ncbi:dipeptidase [Paludifilum halophilum]|nr:dipeptidase [Paludifilum halophilum]
MKWMDGHCDVLYKMWKSESPISFYECNESLDVTYPAAHSSGVGIQVFAVFVPPEVPRSQFLHAALKQVDLFHERILLHGKKVVPLLSREDLIRLKSSGRMGALLSLEGADPLQGDTAHLRLLYRLGMRQVGLTWNHANEVADGIEEERNGGLTRFGRSLVKEMKRLNMVLDVSHLSVRGFWEVIEEDLPVIASHSNCRAVCSHVRNLGDEQIRALIRREGLIGVTFVPKFVHDDPDQASIEGVLRHIDHICALGGEKCIAFGSDFDGIDQKVPGLEDTGALDGFREILLQRYPEPLVRRWTVENGFQFYFKHL